MLVLEGTTGELTDKHFYDLPGLLRSGDVLVFNNSKVIPARLHGRIGERNFEVLLVKSLEGTTWECWVKPGKKAKVGDVFRFSEKLSAELLRRVDDIFILEFNLVGSEFYLELDKIGEMPVPPYILKARDLEQKTNNKNQTTSDSEEYQTVYAQTEGSVAAPTAGLHFTGRLLEQLHEAGIQVEFVTLHVGLGTFQPVTAEEVEDFQIHAEYYEISPQTANRLNEAKRDGRRIIAVGTTSVRVLESAATDIRVCGMINPSNLRFALLPNSGETKIFIYPGYDFKFIDGMITNFHLPKSSLLLLVSAFAGQEEIMAAYAHAVKNKYRFYSYGDGMLIV